MPGNWFQEILSSNTLFNVHLLTTCGPGDPIGDAPLLKSSSCRIRKC